MFPYVCLLVIPFLFSFVAIKKEKKKTKLIIGNNEYVRRENISILVFFFLLFIMLAVRDESIGRDLDNYKYYFSLYSNMELSEFIAFEPQVLYWLLNWAVGQFTDNYQWFLAIVAAITIIPLAKVYNEDKSYSYLKIILFMNMSTFIMLFSGLRQAIAMSISMIAYTYVKKKKIIPFLICVVVALGFHHSAFVLLLMYPIYHMTFKKKHLWIIVPIMLMVFVLNQQIFQFMLSVLSGFMDKYDSVATETGAYGSLILFILFAIFSYVIPDEKKMDRELIGARNLLLLAVAIQCFAPVHNLAMRMNYYYILIIPILLPKVIDASKERYKQVAKLGSYVLCIFFTLDFIISTYNSYITGISALDTIPYVPFWR